MEESIQEEALAFLNRLVGAPLRYAWKSRDTELYEFAFGELHDKVNRHGEKVQVGTHLLHILCRFKVIWRNGVRKVDRYYEDTPYDEFQSEIQRLIGLKVTRVGLSDKNDLWLDLGDYWIVFATDEGGDESWRFFSAFREVPHLVVSDSWIYFVD